MTEENVSLEDLISFASNDLEGDDARRVEAFVARNKDAAATVARYRLVETHVREGVFADPSKAVIARSKRLFRSASAGLAATCRDWIDAVFAHLVYDSRLQPAAVRSGAGSATVQLTFEAKGLDVDLRAVRKAPDDDKSPWDLMGQLSSDSQLPPGTSIIVHASGTSTEIVRTRTDESSMFSMELPSGAYDLCIDLPDEVVILTDLQLE